ncbi:hypothetical protein [Pseudonocardia acidicola]|uniref:hypothetical protein n=1 Tax=Pseudonocardia acidicola TaxID=2724939 RepID=UPI001B7D288E|nr:hypothetical protein [Pseudonocardia acidicola]
MLVLHIAEGLAGGLLVLATWWSVLVTLVVPRGKIPMITRGISRAVRTPFMVFASLSRDYGRTDAVLAARGAVTLLGFLLGWLLLFFIGFVLLFAAAGAESALALRDAGSSLFTLGFATPTTAQLGVTLAAAASGLIVVALQIGYLPALYSSYNRRETLVTVLASRAGVPSWGPEVLVRHQLVGITDSLADLYAQWEIFAADVAESHTNYPVLVYFRSPRPLRSWVVGLLAVMDSAALYLALAPGRAPSEARLCLRMGYRSLREIAGTLRIPVNDDPKPDDPLQLTRRDFDDAVAYIESSGFPVERSAAEAWSHFRGWRVNYEQAAVALARITDAPPALWSGGRRLPVPPIPPSRPRDRRPTDREGAPPPLPATDGLAAGRAEPTRARADRDPRPPD